MMILAIIVSTMIAVALVVFAVEMRLYRKYEAKRGSLSAPNRPAGRAQGASMAS